MLWYNMRHRCGLSGHVDSISGQSSWWQSAFMFVYLKSLLITRASIVLKSSRVNASGVVVLHRDWIVLCDLRYWKSIDVICGLTHFVNWLIFENPLVCLRAFCSPLISSYSFILPLLSLSSATRGVSENVFFWVNRSLSGRHARKRHRLWSSPACVRLAYRSFILETLRSPWLQGSKTQLQPANVIQVFKSSVLVFPFYDAMI